MTQTIVDYMAQPSGCFEPADPTPLRSRVVTNDEFNAIAARTRKPIELGDTTAVLVTGGVLYITALDEVTA